MIVVGVRFHNQDKVYDFNAKALDLKLGDMVIVETEIGIESGIVVALEKREDDQNSNSLKSVLRKATSTDLDKIKKYTRKIPEALVYCRKTVNRMNLPMKLVDAHFSFDGSKVTFYFTADSRIDFRELVKDLTRNFQKSVRLQQIGSRDAAAKVGDCGVCGRGLCCAKFLKNFESITLEKARVQQMEHRGSDRLSGVCGRLMCCLAYEAKVYEEFSKKSPDIGKIVKTKHGEGRVIARNILRQQVEVEFKDGKEGEKKVIFKTDEIKWKKK